MTFTINPTTDANCLVTIFIKSDTVTVTGVSLGTATFVQVRTRTGTGLRIEHWFSGDANGQTGPLGVQLSAAARFGFGATMIAGLIPSPLSHPGDVGSGNSGNAPGQAVDTGTSPTSTTPTQLFVASAEIKEIVAVLMPTFSNPTDSFAQLFQLVTTGFGQDMRFGTWYKIVSAVQTAHLGLDTDIVSGTADWAAMVQTYKGAQPKGAGFSPPPFLFNEFHEMERQR